MLNFVGGTYVYNLQTRWVTVKFLAYFRKSSSVSFGLNEPTISFSNSSRADSSSTKRRQDGRLDFIKRLLIVDVSDEVEWDYGELFNRGG
ncbi:hypothetical protein TNCV_1803271 [Trichonephila clavipes]|uniref:Uncharacterized protein n=1 Tax=Trichonephila clavipes TaxID=2585209 RepID=A0A8X6SJP7_TRICX|nr:hypothetical protein TNCV_1803271 [Trichonephila clavipes]